MVRYREVGASVSLNNEQWGRWSSPNQTFADAPGQLRMSDEMGAGVRK